MFEFPDATNEVAAALAEDLGVSRERFLAGAVVSPEVLDRDVTGSSVIPRDAVFSGRIVAREACTVAGLPAVDAVFSALSRSAGLLEPVEVFPLVAEGSRVEAGTAVAEVSGSAAAVLAGERTALNFLMTLSGIATAASRWADAAGGEVAVCDTRKTWPGLRALSKYAARVGGATNHRAGLYDMVLIKDNHRAYASIPEAIAAARRTAPGLLVEVEADTQAQAVAAVESGADLVLLDNFSDTELASVVPACRNAAEKRGVPVQLEASGGIQIGRLVALRDIGIDRVSSSAITFAPPVDFGLDEG